MARYTYTAVTLITIYSRIYNIRKKPYENLIPIMIAGTILKIQYQCGNVANTVKIQIPNVNATATLNIRAHPTEGI